MTVRGQRRPAQDYHPELRDILVLPECDLDAEGYCEVHDQHFERCAGGSP